MTDINPSTTDDEPKIPEVDPSLQLRFRLRRDIAQHFSASTDSSDGVSNGTEQHS
ncbi:TPA: hypothetical protein QDC22_007544 [Burkholderia stabilis]|nr:hypothetical protein [Burkholderia stabilis]HDR9589155.1 hypothetical protein [Burkholderia stabilis]HDR9649551.1 hypothetical protein [Burkholderia stabilis]HDR9653617.1 hypothetical protein [Burkholderia stabilis]HDR9656312.1 hypothetical protein [Burkholderia stabilis]